MAGDALQQFVEVAFVHRAYHLAHVLFGHFARPHGDGLVEQAECVAHGACGGAAEQGEGGGFVGDLFAVEDVCEVVGHLLGGHVAQDELQAAAEYGNGDFVRVGGGEDEFDVLGRLFQGFEHGVERAFGEHVHFVDDVDFVFASGRGVLGVFEYFADIVDAGVGGGVDFEQVDEAAGVDVAAGLALAAGFAFFGVFAVEAFGEDAGDGGFAHAARAGEQVGVVQAAFFQGVAQGFDDVFLSDEVGEGFRPPFAGEYLVCHKKSPRPSEKAFRAFQTASPVWMGRRDGLADAVKCQAAHEVG